MKLERVIYGDNLFKLPPTYNKRSKSYVSKGRKKQIVTFKDTSQAANNQSNLFSSKEFRLNKGLISCCMDHIEDSEQTGLIEFSLTELWMACGNKRRPRDIKAFEAEVEALLKKLANINVSFRNIDLKNSQKAIDKYDGKTHEILLKRRNSILEPNSSTPLLQGELSIGLNPRNNKPVTLICIKEIPIEACFMILTDTIRSFEVDRYLDPITVRMKDNIALILYFTAGRIKHAKHNKENTNGHTKEILTAHYYQLVGAETKQSKYKARKDITAVYECYLKAEVIKGWRWIAKGDDPYYKIEISI